MRVVKAEEQMKLLTQHLKHSVEEQSHGGKQISRSIDQTEILRDEVRLVRA